MDTVVKSKSKIEVVVGLNEGKIPVSIDLKSLQTGQTAKKEECKAMLLSFFERENKETLKIDLWTHDMQVMEMDRFFYQTLRGMADTYFKATQNQELAVQMQQFVQYFGEKTGIINSKEE
jgi:gliding motility-associated protein GldC